MPRVDELPPQQDDLLSSVPHLLSGDELQQWMLCCMILARKADERLIKLYHQSKIYGGVYLGIGQEAIGAATVAAARPEDLFAPLIRNMSVHVGRGESMLNIFRQWLGRVTGPTRGRDGNVHHGNMSRGVYAMISFLGAMLPVVVGGIMARRKQGIPAVGFAYIGEGGTSTGDFHEAVNFAGVFDVPVIFIVENNHYAYSLPAESQSRCEHFADKAVGYGIEGMTTDGNDAVSLYDLLKPLVDDIRATPRPVIVECETMRMRGHGEHDDFSYVPQELLEEYRNRDPLKLLIEHLQKDEVMTADGVAELGERCQQEVNEAYLAALKDETPRPETLCDGVYADA